MNNEIVRVEAIPADLHMFVEIETSDGYVGTGEVGVWSHLEATATIVDKAALYLVGRSADRIGHHWETLSRFGSYNGAMLMGAISAIDIALWDILGQRLDVPVHSLLGGALRDRVRVYGHTRGDTPAELIGNARALQRAGFTAVGHLNPFLDQSSDEPFNSTYVRRHDDALAVLESTRAALGKDIDLGIELHRRLSPGEAISFIRAVEPIRPLFVEDPIRPDCVDAMAHVQRAVGVPIATGERLYSLNQFQHLLQAGGARYIRPCIGLCGGFTGMMKIAALAQAFDAQIIPHNTYSPILLNACLHAVAAMPNFLILEYPTASYIDHTFGTELRGLTLVTDVQHFADGYVEVPTKSGLGTSLASDLLKRHPPRAIPIHMRPHTDGFFVEH